MARLLLCGEVRGRISALLQLLQALQKKGPFDFVLCVGDFFDSSKGTATWPACNSASSARDNAGHDSTADACTAVRVALAHQFREAYEELQRRCAELPFPIYILDEASSVCVRQIQTQKEQHASNSGRNDSGAADAPRLQEDAVRCDTTDNKHLLEESDVSKPSMYSPSTLLISTGPECTCAPLQLMQNVWLLPGAGVADLHGLKVAFYAFSGALEEPYCKPEDTFGQQQPQQQGESGTHSFAARLVGGWGGFSAFRGRTDILVTTRAPVGIFDDLPLGIKPPLPHQQHQEKQQVKQERAKSAQADNKDGYSVRLISLGIVGEKGPELKAFHALQLRSISAMLQLLEQASADVQRHQEEMQPECSEKEEAAQEARAALFFLPQNSSSSNPFAYANRSRGLELPPLLAHDEKGATGPSLASRNRAQGPPRAPKRSRETGIVLVENLPYDVTDGEALKEAMKQFGEVKFVFIPKDKADPTRSTGKAYVVYVDPKNATKAAEASGQLEGGRRPLRMRLYYDKIPFDRPFGAKRVKCGEVIKTEPHADCWFCLANPQVEKHMIVDIGDLLYSAIPKGGLVPQHLLLIPIAHLPSLAYADEDTCREASLTIGKMRKAFHNEGLDLVIYERYVPMKATKAMHSQIHAIPCKRSESLRSAEFFEKRARRAGLNMQKLDATADLSVLRQFASNTHMGYFYIELPGVCTAQGQTVDRYLHVQVTGESGKIPMNFGREIMAELIGEKDKVNWQSCVVPRDEEERLADALRKLVAS